MAALLRLRAGIHRPLVRLDLRREEAAVSLDAGQTDQGGMRRRFMAVTAEEMVTVGRLTLDPSLRWERWRDSISVTAFGE